MAVRLTLQKTLRRLCSRSTNSLAVDIDHWRVNELMSQLTGLDFNKAFAQRREKLSLPKIKTLTEDELRKAYNIAHENAKKQLAMPPILPEREERGKEIENDPGLNNFDDSKWVFTDISMGIDDSERDIVVREPNGSLREATNEERDRLCQIYFPRPGRQIWLPKLLTKEELPLVLKRGFYLHVLDLVCVQCSPDSSDYIRVHSTVYDYINKNKLYCELYCTKYYGLLIWHLLKLDDLEGIIEYTLSCERMDDVEKLIELHMLVYPDVKSEIKSLEGLPLIKSFCEFKRYHTALKLIPSNNEQMSSSAVSTSV